MTYWTADEPNTPGEVEQLDITTGRIDATQRRPVPIRVTRADDAVYIRSVRGPNGTWYRYAVDDRAGTIRLADLTRQVHFDPPHDDSAAPTERVDQTYREKYARCDRRHLAQMLAPAATIKSVRLTPTNNEATDEGAAK